MNCYVQRRLDLARAINAQLRRFTGIQAVVVGGSVARGYSDAYSDLELMLFWDNPPVPEVRHEIITDLQAEFRYPEAHSAHDSALLIQDFPVDVWHQTVASKEEAMHRVLDEYSTDLDASNVLDTIRTCIPLRGTELMERWKRRVAEYPDELTIRFLQTYLPHFHMRQLNLAVHRENPTAYFNILSNVQSSLFLIILALNCSYFPTYKWMYRVLEDLPIAPARMGSRLRQMFHEPPPRAAAQLHDVLAETLEIVEAQYPQLETRYTDWARYGLDQIPRAYE